MAQPEMVPVSSSNLGSVGYDADTETLWVYFHTSGGLYSYNAVPADVHEALLGAPSLGIYFHNNIKDRFAYTKH